MPLDKLAEMVFTLYNFFYQEEDMVATMQESAQIEKVYKGYFDLTIVNDNFEATYRTLKKALNDMSSETQWVPVNWVYWFM